VREREREREGERESGWRGEGGREERESLVSFEVEGARINREIGCSLIFQTPVRSLNRERKTNGGREGERERERERWGRGGEGRERMTRQPRAAGAGAACVRWRQAAFSHSLNRGTELGPSSSRVSCLVPCHAMPCLAMPAGLASLALVVALLPCSRITLCPRR